MPNFYGEGYNKVENQKNPGKSQILRNPRKFLQLYLKYTVVFIGSEDELAGSIQRKSLWKQRRAL